jgi:hypothetical protein
MVLFKRYVLSVIKSHKLGFLAINKSNFSSLAQRVSGSFRLKIIRLKVALYSIG